MTDTSSIGPGWPPSSTSAARIKGIDTRGLVDSGAKLERLLGDLNGLVPELRAGDCDRLSLRALFTVELIDAEVERLSPWAEAVLPIDDGTGRALVYLGRNEKSRPSVPEDVERALRNVKIAEGQGPKSAPEVLARVREGGYRLRILGRRERLEEVEVHRGVAALYERFGWTYDETRQILASEGSLVAVASRPASEAAPSSAREEIVCAGIAELSHLRFEDGDELRIAEFTEAATRRSHQGRGLYSAVATLLMVELAERSRRGELFGGALDLGFGECSGHDLGVLIAARRLGRRFACEIQRRRSWPFPGYLPQHVPIAGAPRKTRYNDLFPTFLPRHALYRYVDS